MYPFNQVSIPYFLGQFNLVSTVIFCLFVNGKKFSCILGLQVVVIDRMKSNILSFVEEMITVAS